ncbi:PIR protein [Plasmodium yoelii]|uniref:PIR protein n=2 Tax=Plasmodium yoelii TaxID=5861 RepID=A0AAF0B2N8_PLAYO|nr:PIR protein [Plasmodium yoelii]WBY55154.1 PIR protein [Plasmodium yoelii yoelii]CDS44569.1 YIR protein [Plasmodium yoelii]VTZ72767.1 PIR protein [Plasmodium yoelii]|eukprot:XP_022811022.1 PIR protein [Plasmodium yoelii]
MSYKVCNAINTIDKIFDDDPNSTGKGIYEGYLSTYCPDGNCSSDEEKINSGFIMLLNMLDDETIDGDILAEYAILWLSYRLNQKTEREITTLNNFYTFYIESNSQYDDNISTDNKIKKDVIEKKMKSMNIDIKDISNFYDAFKSLCNMYSEFDPAQSTECKTCLETAGELVEKYEQLKNALDINKGSSYYKLLSSLSNDYKIYENIYNIKCNDSQFVACPRSSITKNTLITIAIIFVAASILLGVSYKYSLFGFRKRSQKQHLREKLKK